MAISRHIRWMMAKDAGDSETGRAGRTQPRERKEALYGRAWL